MKQSIRNESVVIKAQLSVQQMFYSVKYKVPVVNSQVWVCRLECVCVFLVQVIHEYNCINSRVNIKQAPNILYLSIFTCTEVLVLFWVIYHNSCVWPHVVQMLMRKELHQTRKPLKPLKPQRPLQKPQRQRQLPLNKSQKSAPKWRKTLMFL